MSGSALVRLPSAWIAPQSVEVAEGRTGEAGVGEGEHTALSAALDRDEVAGSPAGERPQRLALPQPWQRGRLRSRGQKVSGLRPQRLQVNRPQVRVERVESIIDTDVVAHVATSWFRASPGCASSRSR